jgi:hypothetical protein
MVKKTKKQKRRKNQVAKTTRRRVKKGGTRPEGIPEPVFPTVKQLLRNIGEWRKISCLKYKNGSVMVVEDSEDRNEIASCDLIKFHETILENVLYQYIIFREPEAGKLQIALTPFHTPEIGTKHMCLLMGIDEDAQVIASGELFRKGGVVSYSCVSSLFFMHMLKLLYPTISYREKSKTDPRKKLIDDVREYYEREEVLKYMKQVLPKEYTIIYAEKIESSADVERREFKPEEFCTLPEGDRPSCLRYVTDKECETLAEHPGLGYCEAGVDFCSNLDKDTPPREGIPEEAYVYENKFDNEKANAFLLSQGKTPLPDKFRNIPFAKRVANESKIPLDVLKSKSLLWPKPS